MNENVIKEGKKRKGREEDIENEKDGNSKQSLNKLFKNRM